MSTPKVLIVGAGIGGLTAAIALRAKGINVEVYRSGGTVTGQWHGDWGWRATRRRCCARWVSIWVMGNAAASTGMLRAAHCRRQNDSGSLRSRPSPRSSAIRSSVFTATT